ncbi:uncharacterized protein LOC123711833 [Pieris brassicae]|uniref:uncharacterized protein LOC123711833 n=1 Tax=Pieris brassicae TaxID=7116 RepID=UPI001E6629A5|nr:uncharacterized protein LOC123711833 [Pieris brassicae]XP_045520618.1 uncharacterized protein LOC123711833 [Pieris brassicae]
MSISGVTLGEKHKYFNKLSIQKHHQEIKNIDYTQSDVENLLKIKCHNRNVDFILNVLKCEDMLYVSRAIKHSLWLIEDPQYEQIISPHYLHNELLPYMLTEARNKLLLQIRLHLKDPSRNEKFFIYLIGIDLTTAMKWLPNCSVAFITSRLEQDIYRIPENIFLRLLWLTMEPLRVYVKCVYWKKPMLEKAMFTLCKYGEEYFKILDSVQTGQLPVLNAKYTKLVMKRYPQCILNNFDRYGDFIDSKTFAKYIKKDDLQHFLLKYEGNKKINQLFSQEKRETLLKLNKQGNFLRKLSQCKPNNKQQLKRLLKEFHEGLDDQKTPKKYILQFIHGIINKFKTFKFTEETWKLLNHIYIQIGVYNENKKHLEACKKSIILYHVLNEKEVPDKILSQFSTSERFRSEQKKFNKLEKKKVFTFLYSLAEKHIEKCKEEEVLLGLESILILLQDWGENLQNYPMIVNKIKILVESMKDTSKKEALKTLYSRNRIWRKILFNESVLIKFDEDTCLNFLKHNPTLLELNKKAVISLCLEDKPMKRFSTKLRMFWSDTIAKDFKIELMKKLDSQPSKEIFILLPQNEMLDCIVCSMAKHDIIQLNKTKIITLPHFIAKNMYRARPKPSIQLVLSYGKGIYLEETMSSIKSVLHSLPAKQTIECIELQEWPEFVQKLCVEQAFTKFDREDRKKIISSMWSNTKYSSVRADIFKKSHNSLKLFNKNDMNSNNSYNSCIEEEWRHLKCLIESLTDQESIIVYNLLSKIEKVPLVVRTEYCITSYKFLKKLPLRCNCQRFMNNIVSKINYNEVLPTLELDFVAEMVQDSIILRLWSEKLDWTFMNMLFDCISIQSTDEKKIEACKKILLPVLDNIFTMWNRKTQGLSIVRYNMNSFISHMSYKDILQRNNSILLNLVIDSLNNKLPIKENYVMITNFKLAAEYLKVLSKCDISSPNRLYETTTKELSKICIKIFCEDVKSYSTSIWRLFFHAWQMMINSFGIKKKIQYKVNNNILDLSKDLSSDLNILLHIFVLEDIYYTNYGNEDKLGRQALRCRIAAHPSREVKSQCSKLVIIDRCSIPYSSFFYSIY